MTKFCDIRLGGAFQYAGQTYVKLRVPIGVQFAYTSPGDDRASSMQWNVWNLTKRQLGVFWQNTAVHAVHALGDLFEKAMNQCARHISDTPEFLGSWLVGRDVRHRHLELADVWEMLVSPHPATNVLWFVVREDGIYAPREYRYLGNDLSAYHMRNPWRPCRNEEQSLDGYTETHELVISDFNRSEREAMKTMSIPKQAHILALMQDNMTTCSVRFAGDGGNMHSNNYTYKVTLEQAATLRSKLAAAAERVKTPGVAIVVLGKNGLRIAYCVGVDDEPQINLDAPYEYKWIVGIVDMSEYEHLIQLEVKAKDLLREAERIKRKKELMEALGFDNGNAALGHKVRALLNGTEAVEEATDESVEEK